MTGQCRMKQHKRHILSFFWSPLLIAQIILVFVFGMVNETGLRVLQFAGYLTWVLSAIFGWLPIMIFKRKGGVAKGKSYVHTTALVDTGLYSIVRHPQYTAGILFSLALILISQTWLIGAIGLVVIVLQYIDIVMADKHLIRKFGGDYEAYMKRVPRSNFLLGIVRRIIRKNDRPYK